LLQRLVKKHGTKEWSIVASSMIAHGCNRVGKQCRERWFNHLDPDVRKGAWTEQEDELILKIHAEIGNKWTEISRMLLGRPANSVKNRWNSTLKKRVQPCQNTSKKRKRSCVERTEDSSDAGSNASGDEKSESDQEEEAKENKKAKIDTPSKPEQNNNTQSTDSEESTSGNEEEETSQTEQRCSSNVCVSSSPSSIAISSIAKFPKEDFVEALQRDDYLYNTHCCYYNPKGLDPREKDSPWYEICVDSIQVFPEQPWTGGYLEQFFSFSRN